MTGPDGVVRRTRLAAYAWCEDDGRLLLVRVSDRNAEAGRWILPGGGLAFGEDPAAGVLRELAEETGLAGRVEDLVAVRSRVYEPHETFSGHRVHAVGLLYRVSVTAGELRPETGGSSDTAAWIGPGELEALPATDLLRWARSQVGR